MSEFIEVESQRYTDLVSKAEDYDRLKASFDETNSNYWLLKDKLRAKDKRIKELEDTVKNKEALIDTLQTKSLIQDDIMNHME